MLSLAKEFNIPESRIYQNAHHNKDYNKTYVNISQIFVRNRRVLYIPCVYCRSSIEVNIIPI